jgi:hypothetical protein
MERPDAIRMLMVASLGGGPITVSATFPLVRVRNVLCAQDIGTRGRKVRFIYFICNIYSGTVVDEKDRE